MGRAVDLPSSGTWGGTAHTANLVWYVGLSVSLIMTSRRGKSRQLGLLGAVRSRLRTCPCVSVCRIVLVPWAGRAPHLEACALWCEPDRTWPRDQGLGGCRTDALEGGRGGIRFRRLRLRLP